MKQTKKILLIKNRALGDAFIGLAAIFYLQEQEPKAIIHYGVPHWVAESFESIKLPSNTKILPMSWRSWQDFLQNAKKIFSENYDQIYEFHQGGRTRKFFSFFSPLIQARYGAHNHNLRYQTNIFDQGVTKDCIQRDLDGIWSFLEKDSALYPKSSFYFERVSENKKKVDERAKKGVLGLSAGKIEKLWSFEKYEKLLKFLVKEHDLELIIPLSNSLQDQILAEKVREWELFREKKVCLLQTSLKKLIPILRGYQFYIGNDTGLKHIMAYLGCPTFTFFTKESPFEWSPYKNYKMHSVVKDENDKTSLDVISKKLSEFLRVNFNE